MTLGIATPMKTGHDHLHQRLAGERVAAGVGK
jgi:hypothetical protein